ncbi:MAG: TonB-dependent receptor [Gammaproteobacteria bacterium]|nr:TonB-dependent receptor [Gammaproteobacteria bacterium]
MKQTHRNHMRATLTRIALSAALCTLPLATAQAALEEIVVTAQKRVESLQDIPIAMNAYDSENIESMGLNGAKDIGLASASLQMPAYPVSSNNLGLFIRGVGNADSISLTKDNTVGLYYDGVYAGRSTGLLADLSDLERVEILRGPQGTLYGRNTTSGAVNFINAKPTGEFSFKQKLTSGDFGTFRSVTNINLAEIGGVKAKITAAFSDRDGWVVNAGPNEQQGVQYEDFYAEDKEGYRIALSYDAVENLVIDYAFDKADMDTGSPYFQYAGPAGGLDAGFQPITSSFTTRLEETRTPTGGGKFAYTLPTTVTEVDGHNLTVSYDISENLTFKSITGLREFTDNASTSFTQSFGGAGNFEVNTRTDHEQFSQEFQLVGETEKIKYVAGLYYLEEDALQIERQYLDRATFDSTGIFAFDLASNPPFIPCSIFGQGGNGAGGVAPACTAPFAPGAVFPLYLGEYQMQSDVESSAVFGQLSWLPAAMGDALEMTVGLRYTKDDRSTVRTNDGWAFNSFAPGNTESDIDNLDWSLVADYQWSDNISTYFKAASAFRSGGASRNGLNYSQGFEEETLTSYEIGWKTELADRRIRFNGAVYQMNIDDIILDFLPDPVNNPQFVEVFNSGEADISGLEVDLLAALTDRFTLGLNFAYLDYDIKNAIFPDGTDRTQTTELVWAPENAYSVIADYQVPLNVGTLKLHLDYAWQDDQLALANTNFGRVEVPAYGLLNARVSLAEVELGGANWQFAIWAKNLADDDSINYRIGSTAVTFLQPRTVAAEVVLEF